MGTEFSLSALFPVRQPPVTDRAGAEIVYRPISIERGQCTRAAPPGYDLGATPKTGVQHRCVDLPEVWRRSQGNRQYRGPVGHREDSQSLTGQGGISANAGSSTCNEGLTNIGLVCIAPGFQTEYHYTAQLQKDRWPGVLLPDGSLGPEKKWKRVDSAGNPGC